MKWKKSLMAVALAGCMLASSVPTLALATDATFSTQAAAAEDQLVVMGGEDTFYLANVSAEDAAKDGFNISKDITVSTLADMEGKKIKAIVEGDKNAIEVSPESATADNATFKVEAVENRTGTATIKFVVVDAEDEDEIIEDIAGDECTVIVQKAIYIDEIVVDPTSYTVKQNETFSPKYTVKPENANQDLSSVKIDWAYVAPEAGAEATLTPQKKDTNKPSTGIDNTAFEATSRGTVTVEGYWKRGKDGAEQGPTITFDVTVKKADGDYLTVGYGKDDTTGKENQNNLVSKNETKILELDIGEKETVTAYYTKDNETKKEAVKWSSDNTAVATIDESTGEVEAVGAGSAMITGVAADDLSVSFQVNVTDPDLDATGVALDTTTLTMAQGDYQGYVGLVTTPEGADVTLQTVKQDAPKNKIPSIRVDGDLLDANNTANGIIIDEYKNRAGDSVIGYEIEVGDTVPLGNHTIRIPVQYKNNNGENEEWSDSITLTCTLTVTKPGVAAATKMELQDDSGAVKTAEIKTNTTVPIVDSTAGIAKKLVVTPDSLKKDVTYSIANEEVAKVVGNADDGYKVVALKAGKTILTAKLGDKLTQAIAIDVVNPEKEKELKDIRLTKPTLGLEVETTETLKVEAKVGSASWKDLSTISDIPAYKAVWSSSNEDVATVDEDGKVLGVGAGTATITAEVGNYSDTCTVIVIAPDSKPDVNPQPETPKFTDVADDAWYKDAVSAVAAQGWMNGTADEIFEPETKLSRAMAAEILWAKNGKPYVKYEGKFTDVETNDWYANAISWASSKGIVSGRSDTIFDPKGDISRQDFALMLSKEENASAGNATVLDKYTDKADIASYATDAFAWAVEKGVISGVGKDAEYARPTWSMTRAQAAQMFSHLIPSEEA